MSLLRTSAPLRRSTAVSLLRTSTMSSRGYADNPSNPEFSESTTSASAKGFTKKEQANEGVYVKKQEQEKLKALREKLAAQRRHLDDVENAIDDLDKK